MCGGRQSREEGEESDAVRVMLEELVQTDTELIGRKEGLKEVREGGAEVADEDSEPVFAHPGLGRIKISTHALPTQDD